MKRIEDYVILSWASWDELDDGMQFYNCKLNPEFFSGRQLERFEEAHAAEYTNNINVSIQWAESGSVACVMIGEQYWTFQFGLVNLGEVES